MDNDTNIKSGQIREVAEEQFYRILSQFYQAHLKNLNEYNDFLKRLSDDARITNHKTQSDTEAIDRLIAFLYDVKKWLGSIKTIREEQFDDASRKQFYDSLKELLTDVPVKRTLSIPDEFWAVKEKDTLFTKFGKIWWSKPVRIKGIFISFGNLFRRLFGRQLHEKYKATRTFNEQNFIWFSLIIPALDFHDKEEQNILRMVADQLSKFHDSADQLFRSSTFEGSKTEKDIFTNALTIFTETAEFDEHCSAVKSLIDEVPVAEREIHDRFVNRMEQAEKNFVSKHESAGTFLFPERRFNSDKIKTTEEKLKSRRSKKASLWDIHLRGEEEDWLKDLHIILLRLNTEKERLITVKTIADEVNNTIITTLDKTSDIISNSLVKVSKSFSGEICDFVKMFKSESDTLLRDIRETAIPGIMDAILKSSIENIYQQYIREIKSSLKVFEGEILIFQHRDDVNIPPESRVNRITLKTLVQEEILNPLIERHTASLQDIHERLERSFREISEIDQIIEYNANAAFAFSEEVHEEAVCEKAQKLIIEGLKRTITQVQEIKKSYEKITIISDEYISDITLQLSTELQELADNDRILDLKLRLARASTRKKIHRTAILIWINIAAVIRLIISLQHREIIRFKTWYNRIRKITGFEVIVPGLDFHLTEYLTESQKRLGRLPYIYQRLFSLKPLSDRRFYTARDNEIMRLGNAYDLWRKGKSLSIAVIGERGSGKTTFLHFAEKDILSDTSIIRIEITRTIYSEPELFEIMKNAFGTPEIASLNELEDVIIKTEGRKVCICENMHKMFLRTVDGFYAIERFILFIQRTEKKLLWIISCALYGWRYLDLMMNISRYFFVTIELGGEERHEIEDTILKRHRVSGYLLEFETPLLLKKNRAYRKLVNENERQMFVKEHFFELLAKIASGNFRVALLLWLMAVKDVTKEKMIISSDIGFDHAFVYQLPAEELFTLAAVIQHDSLTVEHHAMIFHQDLTTSQLILNRMETIGFLEKSDNYFCIHPLMYRPVVKALQVKNILQ